MKRLMNRTIGLAIVFLVIPFVGWADELPSDFSDIIEDNPNDAPIVSLVFIIILVGIAIVYAKPKLMKTR